MKQIPLTQGRFALVDDADFEWLSKYNWRYNNGRGYALRSEGPRLFVKNIYMHREIMNTPRDMETDHIDLNKLNNQRHNLRLCTGSQNHANMLKVKLNSSSPYKGVCWMKREGRWRARVKVQGKEIEIGYFVDQEEAARAYDKAARKYFGEFARTNF